MLSRFESRVGNCSKVLMLGPELSDQGGMAAVVQTELAAWDHSRFDLRYIGTYNSNAAQIVKPLVALRALAIFIYLMLFWKPDILHIHFSAGVSFLRKSLFVILARASRCQIVLHCHAPNFDVFYEKLGNRGRKYVGFIVNAADSILVVSQRWQTHFVALFPTASIFTLYNAVDCPSAFNRSENAKPVVLTLGRLGRRKGTYDILQAIPQVLEICQEAEFWLGGDGEVEQVRALLAEETWGEQVRLLGWVRDEEKDAALKQAVVFLLPSYQEGFSVAILEAMAYALPVISTPVGGTAEVVVDGETGFLIEPGDVEGMAEKIMLLLKSPEVRQRMGTKGRERIREHFEVDAIMQRLYAIYDSLSPEKNESHQNAGFLLEQ